MTQQIVFIKQALLSALIATLLMVTSYIFLEPQLVKAQETDGVVVTLTVTGGITISDGADITMTPNIGLAVSTSTGSTSWTVITNDPDGYTLTVNAASTSAMQSLTDQIADYTELVDNTPDVWSVPSASNTAEFGFSAYGTDVVAGYGVTQGCDDSSMGSAGRLYEGLTVGVQEIANRAATTTTTGVTTNFCVAVEQSGTYLIPSGTYTAVITATATVQ